MERAVNCLRDGGSLRAGSPRRQQREFVREVFERMVVEGHELASVTPKPVYAPLFGLDRRERFGELVADSCILAPRAGLRTPLLQNPRTGEPLAVPALVVPDHDQLVGIV